MTSPLITASELISLLNSENGRHIRILDATYGPNPAGYDAYQGYWMERIPGAIHFDIDTVADKANPLPHMVPTAGQFAQQIGEMGISDQHIVAVYDQSGIIMAAARAWWMFRLFGHDNVVVLDGGLPAWKSAGGRIQQGDQDALSPTLYRTNFRKHLVVTADEVEAAIDSDKNCIIDARPTQRYLGGMPEPRPHMRSGHIPSSHNVPAGMLIDPVTGCLKAADELRGIFSPLNLESHPKRIITSCGSGVTACVNALALHVLGFSDVAVYDGSWSEWGNEQSCKPIVKHSGL